MSVTAISGTATIAKVNSARIPVDMEKEIAFYMPDVNPFITILMKLKKIKADSYKHEWLDRKPLPAYVTAEAAADLTGAQTLTVSDWAFLRLGEVLINDRTGEVIRVTAAPTTSTVTVYRGAGTTHAAILATDKLFRAGTASEEGSTQPAAKAVQDTNAYNLTQIFKNTVKLTRTLAETKLYGSPQRDTERKAQAMEHKLDQENAVCWGELVNTTGANGDPLRQMKGLFSPAGFVSTNRVDAVDGFTEQDFDEYCGPCFNYGADVKLGVGGDSALRSINAFAQDKLQVIHPSKDSGKISYGITVTKWNHSRGTIDIIRNRSWVGDYRSRCFGLLDLKYLALCPLHDTTMTPDIQAPGADVFEDLWLTETTLMCRVEEAHAFIENM
jgi:hypothetical protein